MQYTSYGLIFLGLFFCAHALNAQTETNQLPFAIADVKKLDSLELAEKREGTFVTGVPYLSDDPINGFGYGAEGSIIFNGKRDNPFFEYTPYLTKLDVALFNTSNQQREFIVTIDKPYIFNSKWRLRGEVAFETNPNLLYFGLDDRTLGSLASISQGDGLPVPSYTGNNYSEYEGSLGAYSAYNTYVKSEAIVNVSGEYAMMNGKMRLILGGEYAYLNVHGVNDTISRLNEAAEDPSFLGVGKSNVVIWQTGLVYDTRDFEPDPNRGLFAEITDEYSTKALGSDYDFNKVFLQVKWYKRLFSSTFQKMVFASRFGVGYTFGGSPFFEYQDEWSSEGSIEGLGGSNTIRGYKQSRFLDRGMYFFNAEIRARFVQFDVFRQHIALSAVPFFDAGSVFSKVSDNFQPGRVRSSEGLGLRVAWNSSTILRFDYAISPEDKQFFFTFGQAF